MINTASYRRSASEWIDEKAEQIHDKIDKFKFKREVKAALKHKRMMKLVRNNTEEKLEAMLKG